MSSFLVVLDACVLIPGSLRGSLLWAATEGLYRVQWTDDILDEVRRNLVDRLGKPVDQAQRTIDVMKREFDDALITNYRPFIAHMPNNLKDRHVLAAAVACGAQIIVTDNLRHFPPAMISSVAPHLETQSPDDFLTHLFWLSPEHMALAIAKQANSNQPLPGYAGGSKVDPFVKTVKAAQIRAILLLFLSLCFSFYREASDVSVAYTSAGV